MICIQDILSASKRRIYKYSVFCLRSFCITELALVNGKTSVSAELALKLSATFNTTPEFWLNAQRAVDLYNSTNEIGKLPKSLIKDAS